eukprot:gnl/TRDRNA2_/TRDRNA2_82234_c0_seq1.p1 gnl/TRDRNA2_/TRDRNA2_82234_c0~~gnl/TRDRNA2_/TRDRNA2_82234_c0_seq1.p1  ORF type:complete len:244 (-),score=28.09 gnl/TRDRNA2_/TRDRNA2_82234_c0_seq1:55-786(-)
MGNAMGNAASTRCRYPHPCYAACIDGAACLDALKLREHITTEENQSDSCASRGAVFAKAQSVFDGEPPLDLDEWADAFQHCVEELREEPLLVDMQSWTFAQEPKSDIMPVRVSTPWATPPSGAFTACTSRSRSRDTTHRSRSRDDTTPPSSAFTACLRARGGGSSEVDAVDAGHQRCDATYFDSSIAPLQPRALSRPGGDPDFSEEDSFSGFIEDSGWHAAPLSATALPVETVAPLAADTHEV